MKTSERHTAWVYIKGGHTEGSKIIQGVTEGRSVGVKRFIFNYQNGNSYERFTISQYDGEKLNTIARITDLGVTPDKSAYNLMSEDEMKTRFDMIVRKGIDYIKLLHP